MTATIKKVWLSAALMAATVSLSGVLAPAMAASPAKPTKAATQQARHATEFSSQHRHWHGHRGHHFGRHHFGHRHWGHRPFYGPRYGYGYGYRPHYRSYYGPAYYARPYAYRPAYYGGYGYAPYGGYGYGPRFGFGGGPIGVGFSFGGW